MRPVTPLEPEVLAPLSLGPDPNTSCTLVGEPQRAQLVTLALSRKGQPFATATGQVLRACVSKGESGVDALIDIEMPGIRLRGWTVAPVFSRTPHVLSETWLPASDDPMTVTDARAGALEVTAPAEPSWTRGLSGVRRPGPTWVACEHLAATPHDATGHLAYAQSALLLSSTGLRARPDGAVIAQIDATRAREAQLLERRGGSARIGVRCGVHARVTLTAISITQDERASALESTPLGADSNDRNAYSVCWK